MTIGFIGTGRLTAAVVDGLCGAADPPARIVLSPRNAQTARRLAGAHPDRVAVAADNQAVVDASAIVVLAVRPQDADRILSPLCFAAEQMVISFMALTPLARVESLVTPAARVVRAGPLPCAARRVGPALLYPDVAEARALLAPVATPVVPADETEFERLWALTGLIAPYFGLYEAAATWSRGTGVAPETAGRYLAAMFHGLSVLAAEVPDGDFAPLVAEAQTPGGLNAESLRIVRERGGYAAFTAALDRVAARLGVGDE